MRHTHYSHRGIRKNRLSSPVRFSIYFIVPALIILAGIIIGAKNFSYGGVISYSDLLYLSTALGASFLRLLVSYIISLVVGVALAILASTSRNAERFLLPLFDTLESIPILVFFPIIILFFINYNFLNLAAIFIISLNMIWNIVFNTISGLKLVPENVLSLGKVFGLNRLQVFTKITLPSIFPYIVTGSLLAWAEGWNMLIVAEVLKTYVPSSVVAGDLFGIGSALVHASVSEDSKMFFGAVAVVVVAVVLINVFVWQRLLRISEKYKFDI